MPGPHRADGLRHTFTDAHTHTHGTAHSHRQNTHTPTPSYSHMLTCHHMCTGAQPPLPTHRHVTLHVHTATPTVPDRPTPTSTQLLHAHRHTELTLTQTYSHTDMQPAALTSPAHPAQLGHTGHIERSLRILVRIVLSEEVVDLVIVSLVLVHDGGFDELWVCQGQRRVGVKLGSLPGRPPQPCTLSSLLRVCTNHGKSDLEEDSEHQVQHPKGP